MIENRKDRDFTLSYKKLPPYFYSEVEEGHFPKPELILFNRELSRELGIEDIFETLQKEEREAILCGNKRLIKGEKAIAMAYCGHQFGYFTMLGDGRAKLIGEGKNKDGELFDIHLKGSGITAYSRRGDGRKALSPALREHLISEAISGLKIPTTRSLAVTLTGESVNRYGEKKGAVLTRTAKSHLRVGTFEFARVTSKEAIKAIAEYSIVRHYKDLTAYPESGEENRYLKLLERVTDKQASLIASWQQVGFIHGVMNTDNMSISGETIDYGPCAFMNEYSPKTVFSSIDTQGRYCFGNQPEMAKWNLTRLGEALLPVIDEDEKKALKEMRKVISGFDSLYESYFLSGMRKKLGILPTEGEKEDNYFENDKELVHDLLSLMEKNRADFTNTFVRLTLAMKGENAFYLDGTKELFSDEDFFAWTKRWKERFLQTSKDEIERFEVMKNVNPFIIPRNHMVEAALSGFEAGYTKLYDELYEALRKPFDYSKEKTHFQEMDPVPNPHYRTFCGT